MEVLPLVVKLVKVVYQFFLHLEGGKIGRCFWHTSSDCECDV